MTRLSAFWASTAIAALLCGSSARGQDAYVPDHFPTIAAALQGASDVDGDGILEIRLRTGTYRENVRIERDDVSLSGEDRDATIVEGDGLADVVRIDGVFGAAIDTLTISGGGLLHDGIALHRSSACRIENCLCSGNRRGISLVEAPGNTISTCVARENATFGVRIARSNGVVLRSCRAERNGRQGFDVVLNDGVSVIANVASDNRLDGLRLGAGSYCQVAGNHCEHNGLNGIFAGRGEHNVFYGNQCEENGENGIRLLETRYFVISENSFVENSGYGIRRRLWDEDDFDAGAPGAQMPSGANDVSGNDGGPVRSDS